MPKYHAPSDCPVCGDDLIIVAKGCKQCGTQIHGEFAGTEFDALDEKELDLLRVFLASRGNMREVEKHLKVSYPTARSRYDAVLAKLGLTPTQAGDDAPVADQSALLARVAAGELSAEEASKLLNQ